LTRGNIPAVLKPSAFLIVMLLPGCVAFSAQRENKIEHLIRLLHDRLALASEIAKAKFNSGAKVNDPNREALVLAAAMKQATGFGVDAGEARKLFVAQIESSKIAQAAFIHMWAGQPKFDPIPDLVRDIRPKLDKLTTSILAALKAAQPELRSQRARRIVEAATRTDAFDGPYAYAFRSAWAVAVSPVARAASR